MRLARETPVDLVARFARLLHEAGAPSDRLEHALGKVSGYLGFEGQFFSTPTSIMMSLREDAHVETRLERLEPGTLNLERLAALDDVIASLPSSSDRAATLSTALDRVAATPPRYGAVASTAGVALVTAAAACIFGGTAWDAGLAGGLALIANVLVLSTASADTSNRLAELVGAAIVAFSAAAASTRTDQVTPAIVIVAALIPFIPGLNLTVAIKEIASRHLVAGTARFSGTMIVLLTLGIGSGVGTKLAIALFGLPLEGDPAGLPVWLVTPALIASAVGFGVLFQALPRDFVWIVAGAALALGASELLVPRIGPQLGVASAAFGVGVLGNLVARFLQRSASIIQVPGLILLVPGSVGFRSVSALFEEQTLAGLQTAFTVLTIGMALVMGLLLASALVPPRRLL